MSSSDDEEYVYVGTPLVDEDDARVGSRKQALDPSLTRSLPVHKQEVTDEQGRKRFHGAFTGGFSAGYYNTVGSKEGFAPASFKSSRGQRSAAVQQSFTDFLDEDEREEAAKAGLQLAGDYDTFGDAAAAAVRAEAEAAAGERAGLLPDLLPKELLAPVASGIGVRLLQKMGWRQGRGIGTAAARSQDSAAPRSKWGTVAGVGVDNTPLYILEPKTDVHGLGFDPFVGAEEFRAAKAGRQAGAGQGQGVPGKKRARGVAFGTGALEETDTFGYMEDYVDDQQDVAGGRRGAALGRLLGDGGGGGGSRPGQLQALTMQGYDFELHSDEEEEGQGGGHRRKQRRPLLLEAGRPEAPMLQSKEQLAGPGNSLIPGFKQSDTLVETSFYPDPELPPGYVPHHTFGPAGGSAAAGAGPAAGAGLDDIPDAPEAPPPADAVLKQEVEALAAMVARGGAQVEKVARKQAAAGGSSRFQFLVGGEGAAYYSWRLCQVRRALAAARRLVQQQQPQRQPAQQQAGGSAAGAAAGGAGRSRKPLSVEERAALLGEQQLPSASGQRQAEASLAGIPPRPPADSAAAAAGKHSAPAPVVSGVADSDKARLLAALQGSFVRGAQQDMGHAGAPQEGLRTAAAGSSAAAAALASFADRFTSGPATVLQPSTAVGLTAGAAAGASAQAEQQQQRQQGSQQGPAEQPVRTFEDWRPAALLCKRFNVPDPYQGKAKPQEASRFKTDFLALPDTAAGLLLPSYEEMQEAAAARAAAEAAGGAPAAQQHQQQQQLSVAEARSAAAELLSSILLAPDDDDAAVAVPGRGPAGSQALPPPPPLPLPPPPPRAGDAAAGAGGMVWPPPPAPGHQRQQQQQQQDLQVTAGGSTTAAAAAAAGAGGGDITTVPVAARPLDLFKAIFEDDSDSGSEEEEEQQQEQGQQQGQEQQQAAQQQEAPAASGLAGALLRAQELAAERAAASRAAQQAQQAAAAALQPPAAATGRTSAAPLPPAALSAEERRRLEVLEALKALKKEKHRKKKSKDKGKDKDKETRKRKHKSREERGSSKRSRHSKGKEKEKGKGSRREGRSSKRRRRSRGSGSDGGSSSGSESDSESMSSDSSGR